MARSFGSDPASGRLTIDKDIILEKFQEAPIDTILDWSILFGLGKKAVQSGTKIVSEANKSLMLNALKDNPDELLKLNNKLKEVTAAKESMAVEAKTAKDMIFDRAKILKDKKKFVAL